MNFFNAIKHVHKTHKLLSYAREVPKRLAWSPTCLAEYQTRRLMETIRYCYKRVPFYRKRWDEHGIPISQIQGPDDLALLPYTTKQDVRLQAEEFVPEGMSRRQLHKEHTSGSTGAMSVFHATPEDRLLERAYFLRYWQAHGMNWWRDRNVFFNASMSKAGRAIAWEPMMTYRFSAFDLTQERLRHYAEFIAKKKIAFLLAYPSLAERLAAVVSEDQSLRRKIALRKVFCASEKLLPGPREFIEQVFGCPVRIHYGQQEHVALFQECPAGNGYHTITDYSHVEFGSSLDGTDLREIIGTSFNNRATLLIRYRTGDYARLRSGPDCSCGWPFPKSVDDVVGRSGDLIVTPSGRYIEPTHLEYAIDHVLPHFEECQFRQDERDHLVILAVPDMGYSDEEGRALIEAVLHRLGEPMRVEIQLLERIERPANQKHRLVVSEIGAQLTR